MRTLTWHGQEYVLPERVTPLYIDEEDNEEYCGYSSWLTCGAAFRRGEDFATLQQWKKDGATDEEIYRRIPIELPCEDIYDKQCGFLVAHAICLHFFAARFLVDSYLAAAGATANQGRYSWQSYRQRLTPAETAVLIDALAAAAVRWRERPRGALRRDVWHPAVIVRMYDRGVYPEGTPPERQFDTLVGKFNEMSPQDQEELEVVVSTYVADFYARLVRRLTKWKTYCGDGFSVQCERED